MSASRMWGIDEGDFPAKGTPRQQLGFALKYAALAPTEINRQSWQFRVADTYLELQAHDDPAWEAIDPDGRELMIGCGAALKYLKLALKHFGCLGRVELFPELDQPRLVARIHFGFGRERDAQEQLLFQAMAGARAMASSAGGMPVSETMLTALSGTVVGERGWLEFVQSDVSRQRVLEITLAGARGWMNIDRSSARPPRAAVDGETSRWPQPLFALGGRSLETQGLAVEPVHRRSEPAVTLAVVKTKTDDKHGWLAAGLTMARAVLQAQTLGWSWGFFNQVRRREARAALRTGIGHKGFAQVILRFGSLAAGEIVRQAAPATTTATFR